jgi:uncharacterized repeat protein (TIGR03803 family)
MQGRNQFPNLFLNIISRVATAALAIAILFTLTVVLSPLTQGQSPAVNRVRGERILHNFNEQQDGAFPEAKLIFDGAGNLYGTALAGGVNEGGTAFELSPSAGGTWTWQVLHAFGNDTDGNSPFAALIFDAAGNLYSTTSGGGAYGLGTVFELVSTGGEGWTEQVLYNFSNSADGADPESALVFDGAGNLYGTTAFYLNSTVFELTLTSGGSWTEHTLYNFADGVLAAKGSLIFDAAGNLYGSTGAGGEYGGGSVFELSPGAGGHWTWQVLHDFGNDADGNSPSAGVIMDAAGNLYGTTAGGGAYTGGTVFELSPAAGGGWTEQILYSFANIPDGSTPYACLTFDSAGNLYGTTYYGGIYGGGTVFELSPVAGGGWTEQVLHSFGNGTDGSGPSADVILDSAGNIYGTTAYGGTYNCPPFGCGVVFEVTNVAPCANCSHADLR